LRSLPAHADGGLAQSQVFRACETLRSVQFADHREYLRSMFVTVLVLTSLSECMQN